jgi:hypothetical protein
MRRDTSAWVAALLLAAAALLGIQRVPCLLTTAAPSAFRAAAAPPAAPCHPGAQAPRGDAGAPASPRCAECAALHRVLGGSAAPPDLGGAPALLALAAAPPPLVASPAPRAQDRFRAGREPDPARTAGVLLL